MTIDPSTCATDELYVVKIVDAGDHEVYAMRDDEGDAQPWRALAPYRERRWYHDDEVTVIRRADQQLTEWEILRQAAAIHRAWHEYEDYDPKTVQEIALGYVADRLEAAHNAAEQEKAKADANREALIEKVKASLIETWGQSLPSAEYIAADAVNTILAEVEP